MSSKHNNTQKPEITEVSLSSTPKDIFPLTNDDSYNKLVAHLKGENKYCRICEVDAKQLVPSKYHSETPDPEHLELLSLTQDAIGTMMPILCQPPNIVVSGWNRVLNLKKKNAKALVMFIEPSNSEEEQELTKLALNIQQGLKPSEKHRLYNLLHSKLKVSQGKASPDYNNLVKAIGNKRERDNLTFIDNTLKKVYADNVAEIATYWNKIDVGDRKVNAAVTDLKLKLVQFEINRTAGSSGTAPSPTEPVQDSPGADIVSTSEPLPSVVVAIPQTQKGDDSKTSCADLPAKVSPSGTSTPESQSTSSKSETVEVNIAKPRVKLVRIDLIHSDILNVSSRNIGKPILALTSNPYAGGMLNYGNGEYEHGREKVGPQYFKTAMSHFEVVYEILDDNGSLVVVINDCVRDGSYILTPEQFVIEMRKMGWIVNDKHVWIKNNPQPSFDFSRVYCGHEYIFHFTKSKEFVYNKNWRETLPDISITTLSNSEETFQLKSIGDMVRNSIITTNSSSTRELRNRCLQKGLELNHHGTFPVEIPLYYISLLSRPDDLVFDPYTGTSVTGEAAVQLNRHFTGVDINAGFIRSSEIRLEKYL